MGISDYDVSSTLVTSISQRLVRRLCDHCKKEHTLTEQEKAISIVRNNWGSDDSITISIENINSDGTYIVTVRDASTTEAKAFYRVNVSDNSIKNAF